MTSEIFCKLNDSMYSASCIWRPFAYATLSFRAGKKWGSFRILCQVRPPGQQPELQVLGAFLCKFRSSANKGKLSKGKFTASLITKEKSWDAAGPKRDTAHRHLMLRARPSLSWYLQLVIGTPDLLLLLLLTFTGSGTQEGLDKTSDWMY